MIQLIGGIFKYSLLVLTVLVMSHIIQVQGVTISQHVLNGMNKVTGYSPRAVAERYTASATKAMQQHVDELEKIANTGDTVTVSPSDQKALNQVIENSQHHR